jgi:hypothetical protein
VFFCIGASTALYLRHMHVGFTCAVVIGCMIGRLASVCGLSVPLNMHAERKALSKGGVAKVISMSQQIVLWCGGLRGAVAFALVLSFPSSWRPTLIGTVAWIVFATTLIGGAGTPSLLDYLGMAHYGGGADDGEAAHTHLEASFGDGRLEALGNADAANAAAELPHDGGTFTEAFRMLELKLLATGSTEAARAAARLAANGPQSQSTTAREMRTSPGVAQPQRDPATGAPDDDGNLDRNWSTMANVDGFTDVAIDQTETRVAEAPGPRDHGFSSPQRSRVGSPPRSTLDAAREVNQSRVRRGSGSGSSRPGYDPAALAHTASAAQRQEAYNDVADGVRP